MPLPVTYLSRDDVIRRGDLEARHTLLSLRDVTDPNAIYKAVALFDQKGRDQFLAEYGYGPSREFFLILDGRSYDSKAIVGVAHGIQFPDRGFLRAQDFSGGEQTVQRKLEALGFTVRRRRLEDVPPPIILVQNEVTVGGEFDFWEDETGVQYHFPNQYRNMVVEGAPFIYYRGVRRHGTSKRAVPEYFGFGRIGAVRLDPSIPQNAAKRDLRFYAELIDYIPFQTAVTWKKDEIPYETIPKNKYRDGVRRLTWDQYRAILQEAGVETSGADDENVRFAPIEKTQAQVIDGSMSLFVPRQERLSSPPSEFSVSRRSKQANAIGKRAEEVVYAHLHRTLPLAQSSTLRWLSNEGEKPGWDLQFIGADGELLRIEVKGTTTTKFVSLELTAQEWRAANEHRTSYYLYLVAQCCGREPQIQMIPNPYRLFEEGSISATPALWTLQIVASTTEKTTDKALAQGHKY